MYEGTPGHKVCGDCVKGLEYLAQSASVLLLEVGSWCILYRQL